MAGTTVFRMILINVIVIIVLVGLLFGGYFYYTNSINYVSTDDAQVTGLMVPITVPFGGRLTSWNATVNTTVNQGDVLGTEGNGSVLAANPGLQPLVARDAAASQKLSAWEDITTPINGTVVQSNATNGQMVQPGQVLAEVVNLNDLFVTANVAETDIRQVQVGQTVDVTVDGIPNTTFKGTVQSIGDMTTSALSLIPNTTAAAGSYTKILQRIPVVVNLNGGYSGKPLVPGMSANVTIHINNN